MLLKKGAGRRAAAIAHGPEQPGVPVTTDVCRFIFNADSRAGVVGKFPIRNRPSLKVLRLSSNTHTSALPVPRGRGGYAQAMEAAARQRQQTYDDG